jgi:hypothetical protein
MGLTNAPASRSVYSGCVLSGDRRPMLDGKTYLPSGVAVKRRGLPGRDRWPSVPIRCLGLMYVGLARVSPKCHPKKMGMNSVSARLADHLVGRGDAQRYFAAWASSMARISWRASSPSGIGLPLSRHCTAARKPSLCA